MSPPEIERRLCRLEDALLLVIGKGGYLLQESKGLAHKRMQRIPLQTRMKHVNSMLITYR